MKTIEEIITEYNAIARVELDVKIKSDVEAIQEDIQKAENEGLDYVEVGSFYTKSKRPEIIYFK